MEGAAEVLFSSWITEAARAAVLSGRGHGDAGVRAAERARLLASRSTNAGKKIEPRLASRHAEWMAEVAGAEEETGPLGWFFLQRLGMFVDAHSSVFLDEADSNRLRELSAPDEEAVAHAMASQGIPTPPPPEWPAVKEATPPGKVIARIGILGDPHIGLDFANRLIPAAIEDLNRENVDLSVTIGDLTQNGQDASFAAAKKILDGFDHPVALTLGNHDMWGGGDEPAGLERFTRHFSRKPFEVIEGNGVRLIALNSAIPQASPFPPFEMTAGRFTDEPNESVPGGRFSDEVKEWVQTLESDGPTFIALHHPPYPYLGLPPVLFGLDEESTQVLSDLLERTGAWGIICGHTHRSALYDLKGVPVIEVPCPKEWPFAYGVIDVSDEGWAFNLKPVTDRSLVEEGSSRTNVLFRRYARGPDEARASVFFRKGS
ncbi:MAG: metallophosphoesterase [Actinobacteria bacterium]|nr:metallophosphoesterase [Actinomycetota bacterium]